MSTRSASVDSRRTDTRKPALAAALSLFADRGCTVTSLREIAERLGVTKASPDLLSQLPSRCADGGA